MRSCEREIRIREVEICEEAKISRRARITRYGVPEPNVVFKLATTYNLLCTFTQIEANNLILVDLRLAENEQDAPPYHLSHRFRWLKSRSFLDVPYNINESPIPIHKFYFRVLAHRQIAYRSGLWIRNMRSLSSLESRIRLYQVIKSFIAPLFS